jgi:hypothetical protein
VGVCRLQADWNIVKRGWDAHVLGKAPFKFTDPVDAIKSLRVSHASQHTCCQHTCMLMGGLQLSLWHDHQRMQTSRKCSQTGR